MKKNPFTEQSKLFKKEYIKWRAITIVVTLVCLTYFIFV